MDRSPRFLVFRWTVAVLVMALSGWGPVAAATSRPPQSLARISARFDCALAIDASLSMARNDPLHLRLLGVKKFIDLAPEGTRIALLEFAGRVRVIQSLTTIQGGTDRQRLKAQVDAMGRPLRPDTNLEAAVKTMRDLLDQSRVPGRPQFAVLVTDGRIDLPDGQGSRQRLVGEVLQSLQAQGLVVYAVGLTGAVDKPLLQRLVQATQQRRGHNVQGLFELTRTAADLAPVWTKIVHNMIGAQPLDDGLGTRKGSFLIYPETDAAGQPVALVVDYRAGRSPVLILPDGRAIRAKEAPRVLGLQWTDERDAHGNGYAVITLGPDAPAGLYTVKGGDRAEAFLSSALWLDLEPPQAEIEQGAAVRLAARLRENEEPLAGDDAQLQGLIFQTAVLAPDGTRILVPLRDDGQVGDEQAGDGVYMGYYRQTHRPGSYRVIARVRGCFTRRSQPYPFRVAPSSSWVIRAIPQMGRLGQPITVEARPRPDSDVALERLTVQVFAPDGGLLQQPLFAEQTNFYRGSFTPTVGGSHILIIEATGHQGKHPWRAFRWLDLPVQWTDLVWRVLDTSLAELALRQQARYTLEVESHAAREACLSLPLDRVVGDRLVSKRFAAHLDQDGLQVPEIVVPPGAIQRFTVVLATRQWRPRGEPRPGVALLKARIAPAPADVWPEMAELPFRWVPQWPWWVYLVALLGGLVGFVGVPYLAGHQTYWRLRALYFRDKDRLSVLTRITVGGPGEPGRAVWLLLLRWLKSDRTIRLPSGRRVTVWYERWQRGQLLVVRDVERGKEYLLAPGESAGLDPDWIRFG